MGFQSLAIAAAAALALLPVAAAAGETQYRATFLARSQSFVLVNNGDALRAAADCRCTALRAGTPAIVTLDDEGNVIELRAATTTDDATTTLPARAIVSDARSRRTAGTNAVATKTVAVTILVAVPPDTPQSDDLFISTDRSGWNAAELRMDRVDALHWRAAINLADGATLLYRFSRGSFTSLERDRSNALQRPRTLTAQAGLVTHDEVLRFGDRP